jgi:hypothetical protein
MPQTTKPTSFVNKMCMYASGSPAEDPLGDNLDADATAAAAYGDAGEIASETPGVQSAGRTLAQAAAPVAMLLSGARVARQIQLGHYGDASFAAADTVIGFALLDLGPVGLALDGALAYSGGTAAAARGAANLGCRIGSLF